MPDFMHGLILSLRFCPPHSNVRISNFSFHVPIIQFGTLLNSVRIML